MGSCCEIPMKGYFNSSYKLVLLFFYGPGIPSRSKFGQHGPLGAGRWLNLVPHSVIIATTVLDGTSQFGIDYLPVHCASLYQCREVIIDKSIQLNT